MSRRRDPLTRVLLVTGLAALTTWLTLLSWRVLMVEWTSFAVPAALLAAVVTVTGTLGRRLGLPTLVLLPLHLVVAGATVVGLVTGSPVGLAAMAEATAAAVDSAQTYAAPLTPTVPPIWPLLLCGAALALVTVDLVAGSLRWAAPVGLVLIGLYTVPVGVTGDAGSWWHFAAATAAFLALLFVQHDDTLERWGRSALGASGASTEEVDRAGFGVRTGAVRGTATTIAASAIAVAVVLPWFVPTLELSLFDGMGGDGEITVVDPMVDLRRDLQRSEDVPLLYVTTDDTDPSYLRISALTNFADGYWSPGDRDIPVDQVAQGAMPALAGVSPSTPREEHAYRVRTTSDFDWRWLPAMTGLTEISASGDWRYDVATMDFVAADEDLTAAGQSYSMRAAEVRPLPDQMDDAVSGAASVSSRFTELPGGLPSEVRSLAAAVTGDARTRFRKAVALQEWFRDNYEYDLGQAESAGRSYADLLAFLDEEDRRGYCEQFAAAMAIMARTLDIPARVAVGFLAPTRASPGVWEYSSDDLHAWPELFFPGSGWVRFEPTPSQRSGGVPAWTDVDAEAAPAPTPSSPRPTGRQGETVPDRGQQSPTDPTTPEPAARPDGGAAWPWALGLGLLVLVLLLLAPRTVRSSRRSRRLAAGDPTTAVERAWEEVHDTVVDLGHDWPGGRSPRATGAWIGARLGAPGSDPQRPRRGRDQDPEAGRALDRLVDAVERDRYAREPGPVDVGRLHADVTQVEAALHHGTPDRTRRRVTWWPRSVMSRRHGGQSQRSVRAPRLRRRQAPPEQVPTGGVVSETERLPL